MDENIEDKRLLDCKTLLESKQYLLISFDVDEAGIGVKIRGTASGNCLLAAKMAVEKELLKIKSKQENHERLN